MKKFELMDFDLIEVVLERAKLILEGNCPPLPEAFIKKDFKEGMYILRLKDKQPCRLTIEEMEGTGLVSPEDVEAFRATRKMLT